MVVNSISVMLYDLVVCMMRLMMIGMLILVKLLFRFIVLFRKFICLCVFRIDGMY